MNIRINFINVVYIVNTLVFNIIITILIRFKLDITVILWYCFMPVMIILASKLQKNKILKNNKLYLFEYMVSAIIDLFIMLLLLFFFIFFKCYNNSIFIKIIIGLFVSVYLGKNIIYIPVGCVMLKYQYGKNILILIKNNIYLIEVIMMLQNNIILRFAGTIIYELDILSFIINKKCFLDKFFNLKIYSVLKSKNDR
jgi:hypothetical protein